MSTLHLVEIDADENIVEELEVDDEVLQALEENEGTELSLSGDDNEVYLVELNDDGEIVDAVAIGQDGEDEDTELSLSDRVEQLELSSIAAMRGMLGSAGRAIGSAASKGFGAVKSKINKFQVSRAVKHANRSGGPKRLSDGRHGDYGNGPGNINGMLRGGGMKASRPSGGTMQTGIMRHETIEGRSGRKLVGLSRKGKMAVAAGVGAAGVGGGFGINNYAGGDRKRKELSLSIDQLLDADYNPLLADVESRTAK